MSLKRIHLVVVATLSSVCSFVACGGSSKPQLEGNQAVRAIVIASYQSLAAGIAYPYEVLQLTAPQGSSIPAPPVRQHGARKEQGAAGLTFVPELKLYVSAATPTATGAMLSYFIDAAGTQPAGALSFTLPGGSTNYVSFPVTIGMTVDLTAGNLLCHGTATIVFSDASGANEMTGRLTLPTNNIVVDIALSLSPTLDVAGSITIMESGETIKATNVSGNLNGDLSCDVAIAPSGWTGTGTLNLTDGAITLHLDTDGGVASAATDGAGNIVITYAGGMTETVSNPIDAPLVAASGTDGGTASGADGGGADGADGGRAPCTTTVAGASGSLDLCFGASGKLLTDIGGVGESSDVYGLAIQPDGKIVAAGTVEVSPNQFALVRYNADGSLDASFNTTGIVTTVVGTGGGAASAVILQPDGKIIVAGDSSILATPSNPILFTLVRYDADGSLDTTFGSSGMVNVPFDDDAVAAAVALQPDGKIVAAGRSNDGTSFDVAVARFNADGSLDATFNQTGTATVSIGTGTSSATAVAIQPDGKIVAAGNSFGGGQSLFTLLRYNADGTLDATLGSSSNTTGYVTTLVGSESGTVSGLALQTDGRMVVVGSSYNGTQQVANVVRYNADGSLDTAFGATGIVTTAFGLTTVANAVALQPDGRIVVAGITAATSTSNTQFALMRYNADGSLDATLEATGAVGTTVGYSDRAFAVALQPDGKIVAAGGSNNGNHDAVALVRYWP